jgi:hypothetical protein
VVGTEGPISTGRFTSVSGADSDGAGPSGGPNDAPPFPGQDFVDPPIDLTAGYAAVISIEPEPDNSPAPFALKPLVDTSIDDVGEGILQAMENKTDAFPTGSATLSMEAPMVVEVPSAGGPPPSGNGFAWSYLFIAIGTFLTATGALLVFRRTLGRS